MPSSANYDSPQPDSIQLEDELGRSLVCSVEHSFTENDHTYYLLFPLDFPVTIVAWDSPSEDAEIRWVEESKELEQIFPDAKAVLAEQDLQLKNTAYTLTVTGDLFEPDDEDILRIEIPTESGQLELEEFQWLATFYHDETEYEIYTPLHPLLFFAKQPPTGDLQFLSFEELQQLQPRLQDLLLKELDRED
ncbi:MAG: DUF3727 domain-containing protein [Kamptonema sp. SIO4C4]|nr:DUF3727 domain-containing protein [Kamptonema sp. SIO4C4]